MSRLPLAGVRALELAEIWAGPFCGALMGDMGAEVVKVEALQRIARGPISPPPNTPGYPDYEPGARPWNRQGNFNAVNRNKLGLTLDLTSAAGVEAFMALAAVSDVVFTNYAFGVMDRLGVGEAALRAVKPDLIALFTPGYGNTGPYKRHRSMGMAIDAVEALQRIARGPISPPPNTPGYPDYEPGARPWNRQGNFNAVNRNKLGLTLDLTSAAGVEAFMALAAVSDVVFTNYAFGVMDRLGVGEAALRAVKPDLIALFTPGYGNTGPYKRHRSMGMAIDAMTGHSALRGYPDLDLSHNSLVHHPDAVGGVTAAFAICAALHYRARTGKGQFIDLSQAEAFMPHLGEVFLEYQMTGRRRERRGNSHPRMSPHGCYRCAGTDEWVAIAVRSDAEWERMQAVMGTDGLASDARFVTLEGRLAHRAALDGVVEGWTAGLDRWDVTARLQAVGIAAGPVLDCGADTYADEHLQARDYFQLVAHEDAGTYPMSGPVWGFLSERGDDGDAGERAPSRHDAAPLLGEHNEYLLGELLGYETAALQRLEAASVIGTVPLAGADMGGVRRARREGMA